MNHVRAIALAFVSLGVVLVDGARASAEIDPVDRATFAGPTDAEIAAKVWGAILKDDALRYDSAGVRVTVRDGVVKLEGVVHKESLRQRMGSVARVAAGAARVVNLLKVE